MTSNFPPSVIDLNHNMFADDVLLFTNKALGLNDNDYTAYSGLMGSPKALLSSNTSGVTYLDPTSSGSQLIKIAMGIGHKGSSKVDDVVVNVNVIAIKANGTAASETFADRKNHAGNLSGGDGNDVIYGRDGSDILDGGNGRDTLNGGTEGDTLKGGNDSDKLIGGAGADKLTGGRGADIFDFNKVSESTFASAGRDSIYDFSSKEGDKIDLTGIDANTALAGNQAFDFIGTAAFHGKAGELRYVKAASDTYVYGDINGDKVADFAIRSDDVITFKGGDFLL